MEIHLAVGENIHRIRKAQKLSIDRAAEIAGVSKSMLGQIERGVVNPTIGVLWKIAQGLHVPLEMLVECREEPGVSVYRAVDVNGIRLCGGKVIRYPLFPFDTDSRSESCQMDIFISGSYQAPDQIPGSMVYVTVLSGFLELEIDGEEYRLESRDSISFPGSRPYIYRNGGNNTVRVMERKAYQK
ncbi:MAG: helix-turn-helix transcriptional regulator [Clostridiales bacterium]|nr:helix-turn-helix transcriptional regulator [Candidatus Cacconaster stercorequi]